MPRKVPLVTDEYYHVFNKSIEGFRIFNNQYDYKRMLNLIIFYQLRDVPCCLSQFIRDGKSRKDDVDVQIRSLSAQGEKIIQVIAYCLMPTHIHFVLKQLSDDGISNFMRLVLNGYARYFNSKYKRLGPLWASRFKSVVVNNDQQLWHLSRYVHLNPTTARLVEIPEAWEYSSYKEYINSVDQINRIAFYENVIDVDPQNYKSFIEDRINYQKELAIIKHLILE